MPTYLYKCPNCDHRFELRQSFASQAASCSRCGSPSERQIVLPIAVVYKGRGWEATRYDLQRDYFGLQRELREVAIRQEKERKHKSRDYMLRQDEQLSAQSDATAREALPQRDGG